MSKKDNQSIKAIEESGATYENVGKDVEPDYWGNKVGGTKCLVVKKLTKSLIDTEQFRVATTWNGRYYDRTNYEGNKNFNYVEEGLRQELFLVKNLKLEVRKHHLNIQEKIQVELIRDYWLNVDLVILMCLVKLLLKNSTKLIFTCQLMLVVQWVVSVGIKL